MGGCSISAFRTICEPTEPQGERAKLKCVPFGHQNETKSQMDGRLTIGAGIKAKQNGFKLLISAGIAGKQLTAPVTPVRPYDFEK